jgi:hypothetical protein
MMGRFYLILALIVFLAGAVWLSFKASIPKPEEISAKKPQVEVYSEEIFKNPVIEQVKKFVQFGELPTAVDKAHQGKDNPFVP